MLKKVVWSFMSSAESLAVADGWSVMSFMNKLNNSGPNTLPWGTPLATRADAERDESIITDWDLFDTNAAIQWYKLPLMP